MPSCEVVVWVALVRSCNFACVVTREHVRCDEIGKL